MTSNGANDTANEQDIRRKFWKALKSDRTMFLGLAQGADGHARPMTAILEDDGFDGEDYRGPIWFFTATDSQLVQMISGGSRAMAHFVSKDHDIWATLHGTLSVSKDRAVIDRLWNRFVAAWYDGGKDDPTLVLIKLDPEQAEIWIDASSIVAGIKMLIGINPRKDMQDKVAKIDL